MTLIRLTIKTMSTEGEKARSYGLNYSYVQKGKEL